MILPGEPADNIIRILAIDPGTTTLGIAILDVDMDTYEPTLVFGHTLKATNATKGYTTLEENRGGRDIRLLSHSKNLSKIFEHVTPTIITAESPFLRRSKVTAFEALVECYAMLRATVSNYSPDLKVHRIDPITAKRYCGVTVTKGDTKTPVRNAIIKLFESKCAEGISVHELDEHTIDAVAVANAMLSKHLLDVIIEAPSKKKKGRRRRRRLK